MKRPGGGSVPGGAGQPGSKGLPNGGVRFEGEGLAVDALVTGDAWSNYPCGAARRVALGRPPGGAMVVGNADTGPERDSGIGILATGIDVTGERSAREEEPGSGLDYVAWAAKVGNNLTGLCDYW